jgi:hypothetical protein
MINEFIKNKKLLNVQINILKVDGKFDVVDVYMFEDELYHNMM